MWKVIIVCWTTCSSSRYAPPTSSPGEGKVSLRRRKRSGSGREREEGKKKGRGMRGAGRCKEKGRETEGKNINKKIEWEGKKRERKQEMLDGGKRGRKELRPSKGITEREWKENMGEDRKRDITLIAVNKFIRL